MHGSSNPSRICRCAFLLDCLAVHVRHGRQPRRYLGYDIFMSDNSSNIGVLWARTSSKGASFMSGYITLNGEKKRIVCFKSTKFTDKSPDWQVQFSKDLPPRAESKVEETPKKKKKVGV